MGEAGAAETQGKLFELIDLIYSAVGDVSLWTVVLERLSEAVNGRETLLFATGTHSAGAEVSCIAHMEPDALIPYAQHYASVNVLSQRCDEMFPTGTVRYGNRAVPDAEYRRTEIYNDYFRPLGIYHSFGIKIAADETPPFYLAIMRAQRFGAFDDPEGRVLEMLLPHLQRALRLHLRFAQMSANAGGLEEALDALGHAVFAVNRDGRVVLMNGRAERLALESEGLRVVGGRLAAQSPAEHERLERCLTEAIVAGKGGGLSGGGSLVVSRSGERKPLQVTVTPFQWHPLLLNFGLVSAMVFVADPEEKVASRASRLRELYGLTPVECRVADSIAAGLEVAAIAQRLRITQETARFYLKSIFRKTGTRRQSDLLKLVLALPGA